jgi:hypothetical protein
LKIGKIRRRILEIGGREIVDLIELGEGRKIEYFGINGSIKIEFIG